MIEVGSVTIRWVSPFRTPFLSGSRPQRGICLWSNLGFGVDNIPKMDEIFRGRPPVFPLDREPT